MRKVLPNPLPNLSSIMFGQTRLTVVLVFCMALAGASFLRGAHAQNFSNLQGKELTLVSGGDLLATGLGRLFGGKIDGRIERVMVTDDRERRLVVKISYSGLDGTKLTAEVQGSAKQPQRQIHSAPLNLASGPSEVELSFDLDNALPEGTTLESAFLTLSISKGNRAPGLVQTYSLPKRWQMAIRPENVVIRITPHAEGDAAGLPALESSAPLPTTRSRRSMEPTAAPMVAPVQAMPMVGPAQGGADKEAIARKTDPAVQALQTPADIRAVTLFPYGLGGVSSRSGRGPGRTPIRLLDRINSSVDIPGDQLTKLSPMVYQDQNPSSGIFYFIPQAYHVYWDAEQSYAMKFLYSEATRDGEAGEVLMSAVMDAKVSNSDRQFVERLLGLYAASHPGIPFTELRQLPIDEAPKVSLAGDLQHQYNIPPDRIVVHSISDVLGQIKVSWVTDPRTKQFMKLALTENVGINGTVTFKPSGGGLPSAEIPIEIKLADAATFGDKRWRRGQRVHNQTPYPMRLKYLHVMLLVGNTPTVYSWNLGDAEVPPQAQVEIEASTIPSWLDARAERMWIDYRPVKSCEPCDEQVFSTITNGVSDVAASRITFRTITPLADTRAYEIAVRVRSKYFDPRSRDLREKPPIILNSDNRDFNVGPIYPANRPAGEATDAEPLFEYFIELTMPDGNAYRSTRWTPGDNLRVLVGRTQIERALGSLPPTPSASPVSAGASPPTSPSAAPSPSPTPAAPAAPSSTPPPTAAPSPSPTPSTPASPSPSALARSQS